MITFLDENDVEYGALATIKATNAVNGERSLTGTIVSGDYVLSNIERGWRLRFDDEYYVVTYAKPVDEGRNVQVEFDAVHQFFWDFDKSSVYDQLSDGSHTFVAYLDFIFKNSGYSYTVDSALNVYAFEKQSFGFKKRLTLFNDIITSTGVEFQVNGKVVRILEKVGTDLSTVVRKNFNMNELTIEKNIGDFVTYQKGFGAYFDEEDHSKGRLEVEYTSPLASVYGKLEAEPFVDERYSQSSSLLAVLKENVDNSYTISVSLDMEDLTRAGYKYKQPVAGDYIMAINETLDFQEKIRIVSFTSEYDVQGILVKHGVTCNDIGSVKKLSASYTHTQHQAANAEANANTAYEYANKALVSADGKNTNYYGDSFPVDNPKGTLKKGDLLFLTIGDKVKQYYWNGADWVINPVLDDVEAFKEQIADELKDVPNREEFENKIAEELANSKAEIETQIETAKTQAESNAKEYADTINGETAKVAELANAAAGEIKADLVNVKNNLTSTSLIANNAQAAVDAAKQDLAEVNTKVDNAKAELTQTKQQLTTVADDLSKAKTDLQNAVSAVDTKATNLKSDLAQAKQDLNSQAQQLQAQANAQSELTKRVSSVEKTANGTKTTVSELSKTVAQNGKDITSVTARTKVVEDDLSGTKTTLSQVKTTADSTSQKTATLETGLNGLNAKFDSLKIGAVNLLHNSKGPFQPKNSRVDNYTVYKNTWIDMEQGKEYTLSAKGTAPFSNVHTPDKEKNEICLWLVNDSDINRIISSPTTGTEGTTFTWNDPSGRYYLRVNTYKADNSNYAEEVQIEEGNLRSTYSQNESDLEQKVAEYKQNADQNYASLQTTVQNLDGTVQHNKTVADQTAQGFTTRIESLETYKDGESERANAYFESAKTETAKQLTAERTAIAKDYVAKSTYTSDVTGIRNDLTATTTTANTIKTNLANYQASNDRAVANLQSNLQTANGNISSLKTKVEAVPGQITSAVSSVESKIPTNLDSLNLMTGTRDWSTKANQWHMGPNWSTEREEYQGLKVHSTKNGFNGSHQNIFVKNGDIVTFSFFAKATNTLSKIRISSCWDGSSVYQAPLAGVRERDEEITITSEWKRYSKTVHITSDGSLQFRTEYIGETIPNGNTFYVAGLKLAKSSLDTGYSENPTDVASDITNLSSEIKQTADGITLLATKTELNTAKNELQSGINTATNKANSNAQTISTHTNQISALNTGLQAKVSQTEFNTLSGRVTSAENNIIAKANELSSKITSVEGKVPTSVSHRNLAQGTSNSWSPFVNISTNDNWCYDLATIKYGDSTGISAGTTINIFVYLSADEITVSGSNARISMQGMIINKSGTETWTDWYKYYPFYNKWSSNLASGNNYRIVKLSAKVSNDSYSNINGFKISVRIDGVQSGKFHYRALMVTTGDIFPDSWSPAPEDTIEQISSLSSEFKQTTDSIKASVSSLDSSTVKSSSLTINADGIVMKAGKSTTDVANAIGSYFAVNQNAIDLFSDKINVKGNMIVSGAITSDKIASKSINTAHLNGKIITADVISSNAVTTSAIKAGAVTTDKMSANSINGDRIAAGTLDAAKIKAGSITASQIASGTITSNQIKAGSITASQIASGTITGNQIKANSVDVSKIVGIDANFIKSKIEYAMIDWLKGKTIVADNGATKIDLLSGYINFDSDTPAIRRVTSGIPTQFVKFLKSDDKSVTTIGSNRDGSESSTNDSFAGIKITSSNLIEQTEIISDQIYFLTGINNRRGWQMSTVSGEDDRQITLFPIGNPTKSNIYASDYFIKGSNRWVNLIDFINYFNTCLAHLQNYTGRYDIWNAFKI